MDLLADATGPRALLDLGQFQLLSALPSNIIIPEYVEQIELGNGKWQSQLAIAKKEGWLRVLPASISAANQFQQSFRLGPGECHVIDLALTIKPTPRLLIDEGPTFRLLRSYPQCDLVCLADILHELETFPGLPSAASIMSQAKFAGVYSWSSDVYSYYSARRKKLGLAELPHF